MIRFPRILTVILFIFQGIFTYSQDRCGTVEYNEYLHQIYPFLPTEKEFEYWIQEKMKEREYKSRVLGIRKFQEEIYTIPVVVHVIHNGEEIGEGTMLGRILGQGSLITGRVFGVKRIPVVKGQGIPAWDPRTTLATGVTLISSPQGADHTAGRLPGVSELQVMDRGSIASLSKRLQIETCVIDSVGLCFFANIGPETFDYLAQLVSSLYGRQVRVADLMEMGEKVLDLERGFNSRAGFSKGHDRLPEFMRSEPLLPNNSTFSVPDKEIDGMFNV